KLVSWYVASPSAARRPGRADRAPLPRPRRPVARAHPRPPPRPGAERHHTRRTARRRPAERLQAPRRVDRLWDARPPKGRQPRLLPRRRPSGVRALRTDLRLAAGTARDAERTRHRHHHHLREGDTEPIE